MILRWFLFGLVNVAIMLMISIVLRLLGLDQSITAYGINYQSLLIMCLFWGMGGSLISLLLSKQMAKWMMGVQIQSPTGAYSEIVRTVHDLARRAGLKKMPEVGVYDSPEINAFATGPTKNNSLVAVSTGLLQSMDRDEMEGVLGHEVAHIANGDMVTMTLIQGIVNAFVMFFARIVAFFIDQALRSDDREGGGLGGIGYFLTVLLFQFVFGIIGAMITAWFSRFREFRADAGGAALAGKDKMIKSLRRLQTQFDHLEPQRDNAMASLQISAKDAFALLATHPPLAKRIEALQKS